jgi:hypothetical protein
LKGKEGFFKEGFRKGKEGFFKEGFRKLFLRKRKALAWFFVQGGFLDYPKWHTYDTLLY